MLREILESIKEVVLDYVKHRLFPITALIVVLFCVLIRQLFVLQIVEGQEHMDNFTYKSKKTLVIDSVRGNIRDRNGKLLAYNELSYSVIFSNDNALAAIAEQKGVDENTLKNDILLRTIKILEANEDDLYVDFPIIMNEAGEYEFLYTDSRLKTFLKDVYAVTDFDDLEPEEKNSTPDDVVSYLCDEVFEISADYEKEDRLNILACRYKLWMNRYQQYMPVTIAYDISEESNASLSEYGDELVGITVEVKSLRKYNDAEYFAHIIGYVGGISDTELKEYNANLPDDEKYSNDEMVGKTGIEQYCENELRGTTGYEIMYVDNLGKVIETVETKNSEAGNDVYLTIDADLQKYCYDTLEKEIASILLANLTAIYDIEEDENALIPICDVYSALFNNNIITIDKMKRADATPLEVDVLGRFEKGKTQVLNELDSILTEKFTPVEQLDEEYQGYMEYICEILNVNNILTTSMISPYDQEYLDYTENKTSLEHYLKYAISIEAIDISSFEVESSYYDTDEIYDLLCEYIINYLSTDPEFDKLVLRYMIESDKITGDDMVHLLYDQGVLREQNDLEYEEYNNGAYPPYNFFVKKIKNLEITPAMLALDPCSGSIVVTDVKTGDVLALVTYPSYDNNFLTNEVDSVYYDKLLNDKTTPLINRATQHKTAPGSTYKIVSSVAGLTEHLIDNESYFSCMGEFDEIEPAANCWLYPDGHGALDVEAAIQHSCNVFFYNIGYGLAQKNERYNDLYGLERLNKYATMFGFDAVSGVELPESEPSISDSDAVRSAIGQGTNLYTPVQLARYVTTVANMGTCYDLTLIDRVTDYEGNEIRNNQAKVHHTLDKVTLSTWNSVHEGMRRVISVGVKDDELINQINVDVSGKTGTAQESDIRPNHALFISYAPSSAPEVSVTCVIQHGYSSGNARELASFVYAYMYDSEKLVGAEMKGNTAVSD